MDRGDIAAEIAAELPFVARIGAPDLVALVERVWLRLWAESGHRRLADAPWFTVTRVGEGGVTLVEHVRRVARLAEDIADAAEREGASPDRGLLRAGAALIDVDKLVLTRPDAGRGEARGEDRGPHGAALYAQHTFYGAHVALAEGAPWPLVHLILSHSKNTGVRPRTVEAVILHYADYAVFDVRNIAQGRDRLAAEQAPSWAR